LTDDKTLRWLNLANGDLKAAELIFLYGKEELMSEIICFHCQQSVEKFLKAFLNSNNINFPKTHDLLYLKKLCCEADNTFSEIDVRGMTAYAVEARYPEEFFTPTKEETQKAFLKAKAIKSFILNRLNTSETNLTLF
jgi:HEPN domain-containing protein